MRFAVWHARLPIGIKKSLAQIAKGEEVFMQQAFRKWIARHGPALVLVLVACSVTSAQDMGASGSGDATNAQQQEGIVVGRVIDPAGKGISDADVVLMRDRESVLDEVQSDDDGRFTFAHISPGCLQLRIMAEGFATIEIPGTMSPGENYVFPEVKMSLATQITEIHVSPPPDEIAQEQFKEEINQRVFGIVPNFYVSYAGNATPLTPKEKFLLALKASTDPVSLGAVSIVAGVNQASDRFSGYGQGAEGYAKRYGASYANFASGLFIGGAVLPSILKQDPRYFYKGTGTKRSRFLYAVSRVFICKGDNQQWQPNYSSVLGDLAAGGLSNLYIPERDHHGARLTFENAGIAMGTSVAIDVLQEFVLRKITSRREQ
jgi:Carboxypeptidase regulatory-like domain